MIRLEKSLLAWGTPEFHSVLKQEIAQLGVERLPLQQGLTTGNYVTDNPITVLINRVDERDKILRITAGIFYNGVISGCSCADDPSLSGETNEFCEVQLDIDMITAETVVALLQ